MFVSVYILKVKKINGWLIMAKLLNISNLSCNCECNGNTNVVGYIQFIYYTAHYNLNKTFKKIILAILLDTLFVDTDCVIENN